VLEQRGRVGDAERDKLVALTAERQDGDALPRVGADRDRAGERRPTLCAGVAGVERRLRAARSPRKACVARPAPRTVGGILDSCARASKTSRVSWTTAISINPAHGASMSISAQSSSSPRWRSPRLEQDRRLAGATAWPRPCPSGPPTSPAEQPRLGLAPLPDEQRGAHLLGVRLPTPPSRGWSLRLPSSTASRPYAARRCGSRHIYIPLTRM
jgi:hypothetical protein